MNAGLIEKFQNTVKKSFIGRIVHILHICVVRFREGEYSRSAVALTYYTLFAIVPMLALLFGIAKGFDMDTKLRASLTENLSHHRELLDYVCNFADTTLKQARGGVVAGVGVAALFFAVIGLSTNIERSLNAVWGLPPRRNLLHRYSNYIACLVVIPMLMVMVSSAGVFLRTLASQNTVTGFMFTRVMPPMLASLIFFLIYLLAPTTRVRLVPALVAGITAGICFQLLQDLFVMLQKSIYTYNRVYGSFAALPLFMVWLRWSWEIALFGAELGFVMQNVDTGMFDFPKGSEGDSQRCRRFRQLAVARRIYAKFYSGDGASGFDELVGALALPMVFVERDLGALADAGVVCRVEDTAEGRAYVPLLPPSLTIAECLQRLDACGDDEIPGALREAEAALSDAEEKLHRALLKCPDDLPLAEVGRTDRSAANA